jgi:hypothetical protein
MAESEDTPDLDKPQEADKPPDDLEACPRCGEPVEVIIWGQTNCSRCGLHFECC